MGAVEERIRQQGIVLPAVFEGRSPRAVTFKLVQVAGDIAYVSGHGPMDGQRALLTGKVGDHRAGEWLSQEAGYEAARLTALSITASLRAELGDLDRVVGWLNVLGFVAVAPGFSGVSFVMNGFSDVIRELWGDEGHCASTAVGVAELSFGVPVWAEAVVTLG